MDVIIGDIGKFLKENGAHPSKQGQVFETGPQRTSGRKPVLYLAGPINGCSDSDANDWRSEVKERLSDCYDFLDPMARDYRGRENESYKEIVRGDLADIEKCHVIIANCPKPSVGTSMEIYHAFNNRCKRVIVVAPVPMSPWLKYFSTAQYTTIGAAVTYARTISKSVLLDMAVKA